MGRTHFWLDDEEWARIEPYLPRGRRGAHRVDDRRVISGIIHMLKIGARWRDCPRDYGPYTTVYNRFNRWSRQGVWTGIFYALTGSSGMVGTMAMDSTHIKAHRSAAGAKGGISHHAIGRSRGGRTTKIHALTDDLGRPLAFLYARQAHDLVGAASSVGDNSPTPPTDRRSRLRRQQPADLVEGARIKAVIPPNPTRKHPHAYDPDAYKGRNLIERMFCRLKDFRRIATRYDKRADTFLSPSCWPLLSHGGSIESQP